MAAKRKTTLLVKLASTAKVVKTKADGTSEEKSSVYFYVKKRNPKKLVNKLSFRKYDPVVRKHVIFKEEKLK